MDKIFFALVGVIKNVLELGLFVNFFSIFSVTDEKCTLKVLAIPIGSFVFPCSLFKQFISLFVFSVILIISFMHC